MGMQMGSDEQATTSYTMTPTGKYCASCGQVIDARAEICPKCGVRQSGMVPLGGKSKVVAGLLAIFLGMLGIHKFYLGQTGQGLVFLILWLVAWPLCFLVIGFFIFGVLGLVALIQGIIYLTMSDQDFSRTFDRAA